MNVRNGTLTQKQYSPAPLTEPQQLLFDLQYIRNNVDKSELN